LADMPKLKQKISRRGTLIKHCTPEQLDFNERIPQSISEGPTRRAFYQNNL
jgi:hypothetical protein